jgi:hypothetical protein
MHALNNSYSFVGGTRGAWRVTAMRGVIGASLAAADYLDIRHGLPLGAATPPGTVWQLQGLVSNVRYAERDELAALAAKQQAPGRIEATCAALIPIRKSAAWWALSQDERRAIFEETSHHNAIGMDYLPAIARRLHHCRDIGEPFDFLTWFEYAPEHAREFEALVAALRATPEWDYVEREVDIRLVRHHGG